MHSFGETPFIICSYSLLIRSKAIVLNCFNFSFTRELLLFFPVFFALSAVDTLLTYLSDLLMLGVIRRMAEVQYDFVTVR